MRMSAIKFVFGALVVGLFLAFSQTIRAQSALDAAYNPSANDEVLAMALQPDGKILVGGRFHSPPFTGQISIGGQQRNYIARLNSDGTADTTFNPNADNLVRVIALQTDGKILVAGNFTQIGGSQRSALARLNADGTADTAFTVNADGQITSIAIQTDGKIVVGGTFFNIGGTPRREFARLNADGTVDTTFFMNPTFSVYALAIQPDGRILVSGRFPTPAGGSRNRIVRLNSDGTFDTTFSQDVDNSVNTFAIQPDGKILIGGYFTFVGANPRNYIARLNPDGTLDLTFTASINSNAGVNSTVFSLTVQPDLRIVVGGVFTYVNGQTRTAVARLNTDGTLDSALNVNVTGGSAGIVRTLAVQSDNKILIAGYIATVDGQVRNHIARLNAVDSCTFSLNSATADVPATAGSGTFTATATAGTNCSAAPQNRVTWLTTTISGSTVTYTFQPNHTTVARSGTISVGGQTFTVNQAAGTNNDRAKFDFDGDGKSDIAVFRPSNGAWYILLSQTNAFYGVAFGQNGDQPAPGDYDGDGKTDIAVYRTGGSGFGDTSYFYVLNSSDNLFNYVRFGTTGDVPLCGDWDNDGKDDFAYYKRSTQTNSQSFVNFRLSSQPGVVGSYTLAFGAFGPFGDTPVFGDFDGDDKLDPAVYRRSTGTWIIFKTSINQVVETAFGLPEDIPVPADYNGDGLADIAVFRPSTGVWYTSTNPATNYGAVLFGTSGDYPVPADYDGDRKIDVAVFRRSNGTWYLNRSTAGFTGVQFGASEDKPIPLSFIY